MFALPFVFALGALMPADAMPHASSAANVHQPARQPGTDAGADRQIVNGAIDALRDKKTYLGGTLATYLRQLAGSGNARFQADDMQNLSSEIGPLLSKLDAAVLDRRYGDAIGMLGEIEGKIEYMGGRLAQAVHENGGTHCEVVVNDLRNLAREMKAEADKARAAIRRLAAQ